MSKQGELEAYYGLPRKVVFCKRCVQSNQRPVTISEFKHKTDRKAGTLNIWDDGICDGCHVADAKEQTDWEQREEDLKRLLDQHRRNDGNYDCLVPGSGGKDSAFAAHLLKYKYGMNPLTVTWPPILYTDIGLENFRNWIEVGGFDNITFKPNGRAQKLLTKLAIENLMHPFQTFILGQKNLAPKIAAQFDIPLVFYGESGAEYTSPIAETSTSLWDKAQFAANNLSDIYFGGVSIPELQEKYDITLNELSSYLPPDKKQLTGKNVEIHWLGYYIKWMPQEAYYYAIEHCGFKANPVRTEGTFSKYNSLDDKIDGLHWYTMWIKFGQGRTTHETSQEIRNKHITREEAILLIKRFEGEFPERYFKDVMEYIEMDPEYFLEIIDNFRSPHLWRKDGNEWALRHPVWEDGQ